MAPVGEPVVFKLHGERRLYRPDMGRYATVSDLLALARNGAEVVVRDAMTGADITQFILAQNPTEH